MSLQNNRTSKSRIRSSLRALFLRSKEHSETLKRDDYSCVKCGIKKSVAKGREVRVEVHHKNGIDNWDKIIKLIQEKLLCDPKEMETLCKECHKKETYSSSLP